MMCFLKRFVVIDSPFHWESQSNEAIGTGPNPFCHCRLPRPVLQKSCRTTQLGKWGKWRLIYESQSWTSLLINFPLCILSAGLDYLKPEALSWLKLEITFASPVYFSNPSSSVVRHCCPVLPSLWTIYNNCAYPCIHTDKIFAFIYITISFPHLTCFLTVAGRFSSKPLLSLLPGNHYRLHLHKPHLTCWLLVFPSYEIKMQTQRFVQLQDPSLCLSLAVFTCWLACQHGCILPSLHTMTSPAWPDGIHLASTAGWFLASTFWTYCPHIPFLCFFSVNLSLSVYPSVTS